MQPYVNPYLFQQPQYQQYQPYQQQVQQQIQDKTFVNSFDDITANDVPMDGRYKLFAKNDMSEVQAKCWSSNGLINTIVFKAENSPKQSVTEDKMENVAQLDIKAEIEPIFAEIKALNEKIDKMCKPRTRKEVADES